MSFDVCSEQWESKGNHVHRCLDFAGHSGTCFCPCGEIRPVVEAIPIKLKWQPKPYYKRRKGARA